jgi:hypothetical protein
LGGLPRNSEHCRWGTLLLLLLLLPVGYQYDVSGLFGAAPSTHPAYDPDGTITGVPVDLFNRKLQVRTLASYPFTCNTTSLQQTMVAVVQCSGAPPLEC